MRAKHGCGNNKNGWYGWLRVIEWEKRYEYKVFLVIDYYSKTLIGEKIRFGKIVTVTYAMLKLLYAMLKVLENELLLL